MIPRPEEKELYKQPNFLPMRLLAATLAYYIHKQFIQGTTMVELQKKYIVCPKTLTLCITGKKYQGGTNRKAQERRKWKNTDDEKGKKEQAG